LKSDRFIVMIAVANSKDALQFAIPLRTSTQLEPSVDDLFLLEKEDFVILLRVIYVQHTS